MKARSELQSSGMKRLQLEAMSLDELWELHEEIPQILSMRIIEEKQQLEQRLERLNQAYLNSMGDSVARGAARARRFYPRVYPRYRNPQEPTETWSGRGKQPRWLVKALREGNTIEDFRIDSARTDARGAAAPKAGGRPLLRQPLSESRGEV